MTFATEYNSLLTPEAADEGLKEHLVGLERCLVQAREYCVENDLHHLAFRLLHKHIDLEEGEGIVEKEGKFLDHDLILLWMIELNFLFRFFQRSTGIDQ